MLQTFLDGVEEFEARLIRMTSYDNQASNQETQEEIIDKVYVKSVAGILKAAEMVGYIPCIMKRLINSKPRSLVLISCGF